MTSDWIKMRTDLYRDPKVCLIADFMMRDVTRYSNVTRNVMRNVTVGALVTLWGVTRNRGKRDNDDLVVRGARLSVVDDITELPGFGAAMASVGWVVEQDDGIKLPRFFEEFNSDPTEYQKEKNAERQRRYREKCNALRNVTVTSHSNIEKRRVEKSREENTNTPKSPFIFPENLNSQVFLDSWELWLTHRSEIRKPIKPGSASVTQQLAKLSAWETERSGKAAEAIRLAVSSGWTGLFDPDSQSKSNGKQTQQWAARRYT